MTACFKFTFLYLLAATAVTCMLQDDWLLTLRDVTAFAAGYLLLIGSNAVYALPVILPLAFWFLRRVSLGWVSAVILALLTATFLQAGFLFFKSAIPQILPFYADDFFAALDRALLFGHDGWAVSHAITPDWLAAWFPQIYLTLWSAVAYAFPILVAATDPDPARQSRYVWLFVLSWVVAGNLLALAGSSVGPVYYDLQYGTDRFADMHAAFLANGYATGPIAWLQNHLWEKSAGALSYISAFPSMHVAVACIAAVYLHERFPRLWPVGGLFLGLILLISVYSGYHYLVDGIASIAVVLALNAALQRRWPVASLQTGLPPAGALPAGLTLPWFRLPRPRAAARSAD